MVSLQSCEPNPTAARGLVPVEATSTPILRHFHRLRGLAHRRSIVELDLVSCGTQVVGPGTELAADDAFKASFFVEIALCCLDGCFAEDDGP